ncbi:MAG: PD-(D/E)XK nuclease family protein [Acidobacteriota bacterium]
MDNATFQERLLDLAAEGYTLLVESDRLSHQLERKFRLRRRGEGRPGWDAPSIVTFNRWSERLWESLWPTERAAPDFLRWRLLAGCMEDIRPPEPLEPDISLVLAVDESFGHCLRYGLSPGEEGADAANPLVEWRRSLWEPFSEALRAHGFFHRASLPEKLYTAFELYPDLIPRKIAIAGFEFAGFWEKKLFGLLAQNPLTFMENLPAGEIIPGARAFADPEQEVYGLIEDLVSAPYPLHELAVVVLDPRLYYPILSKTFEDVFGPPLEGDHAAYNLFPNTTLTEQPLYRAAMLPFEFAVEGQPRHLLLSLLRSPYYDVLAKRGRALCQWDLTWRRDGIESGLSALLNGLDSDRKAVLPDGGEELTRGLAPFLARSRRSGVQWRRDLEALWNRLGFPVLANESDHMAWKHLTEILDRLETGLGAKPLTGPEFVAWLNAAAGKTSVQESGIEDAGIQVMGPLDARGLSFKRLYVTGLMAGALPQPPRPLPFLSPQERKRVQGGNAESQYHFGNSLFGLLRAIAPETVLSRPLMDREGEPCLASPFWPQEAEERVSPVAVWRHGLPALQRSRWVADGLEGIRERLDPEGRATASRSYQVADLNVPEKISVSSLETLLSCPSRYLFQYLLRMEPLPEAGRGIDPAERGQTLHAILHRFGKRVIEEFPGAVPPLETLQCILREVVEDQLKLYGSNSHWAVEKRRLLGEEKGVPGLLAQWLLVEWDRFREGWRWIALEAQFSGMDLGAVGIRGRLDRLDFHPDEGFVCWDYKTGRPPSARAVVKDLSHPQLPAYLSAVRRGLIREAKADDAQPLGAGYVELKSVRDFKHTLCIKPSDEADGLLDRWENLVADALARLTAGELTPRGIEKGLCDVKDCPYGCLCGMVLISGDSAASTDDET